MKQRAEVDRGPAADAARRKAHYFEVAAQQRGVCCVDPSALGEAK